MIDTGDDANDHGVGSLHSNGTYSGAPSIDFDVDCAIESLKNLGTTKYRQLSHLCSLCQRLIDQRADGIFECGKHHKDWRTLKASALSGCSLCSLIQRSAQNFYNCDWPTEGVVNVHSPNTGPFLTFCGKPNGYTSELEALGGNESRVHHGSSIRIIEASQQALDYDAPSPRTSTLDGLPLAKHWLRHCQANHNTCHLTSNTFYPSRLIDISGSFSRLRTRHDLEPGARYVALSHCWGSLKYCRLTKNTLPVFLTAIPSEALPKTFKHAISISRYFGFSYIWIDSLCILQDSTKDWHKECAEMQYIYGNCELNIAATSAEDASVGCFFRRDPLWRCQTQTGGTHSQTIWECYDFRALRPDRNILERRAWVVQERFLSRRTLHLAENMLFWECNVGPACEIFPFGYPDYAQPGAFRKRKHTLSLPHWPGIVSAYSLGDLTRTTDKFVAIEGLARLVQSQTQDLYVAGLWKNNIEDQLCWTSHDVHTVARYKPYVAPTWSWASLAGEISYSLSRFGSEAEDNPGRLCIAVQDVNVQYASNNVFGEIRSGRLRLKCDFLFDGIVEQEGSVLSSRLIFGDQAVMNVSLWYDARSKHVHTTVSTQAFILPIRDGIEGLCAEGCSTIGLLLEPTNDRIGEYRRVGFFWALSAEKFREGTRHANLVNRGQDHRFSDISCGQDGTQDYCIDLV